MGLRIDIETALIACELRGSRTVVGINMIIFAAELALNHISLCSKRCFFAGFDSTGLVFLFGRDGLNALEMGLGSISHIVFVE